MLACESLYNHKALDYMDLYPYLLIKCLPLSIYKLSMWKKIYLMRWFHPCTIYFYLCYKFQLSNDLRIFPHLCVSHWILTKILFQSQKLFKYYWTWLEWTIFERFKYFLLKFEPIRHASDYNVGITTRYALWKKSIANKYNIWVWSV